ncbi:ribonuclease III [Candidatus Gottesmanbacteria bacterium]|nr:ribonuclease III [Candidatus Gottesmanbacteria bacterium]
MGKYGDLLKQLNIKFVHEELLIRAFNHRSYLNETKNKIESNERLEFLGDTVLSFLVSDFLFNTYPKFSEGYLTNLRSSLVKTTTLAKIAQNLNLGNYLKLSKGEEESGGRKNSSLLADTFEALIGAIFLDSGLKTTKIIIEKLIFPMVPMIIKDKSYKDSKSTYQEIVQETTKNSPLYQVMKETGPDHAKEFTVGVYVNSKLWGTGVGRNKQEAEQSAATNALENWNKK